MSKSIQRRKFIASMVGLPVIVSACSSSQLSTASGSQMAKTSNGLKTSLNAFSFNGPLSKGEMTISDMLDFCAANGFEGVDITGYYFTGYPQVPPDDYLFGIKRKAFGLSLEITGTGVRNDFTIADKTKREQEVVLVKKWIEVAAKLGAPVIRVFAGNQKNEGISTEQVTDWMLKDIQTCVDCGKQYGVIIGLQNHNDFIQTADQVNKMIEAINSEWLGLILDTCSYRVHDPYDEIAKSIKHTVNWQIKENVFINGKEVETDMKKLFAIIKSSSYKGYLPIETLGEGDPKVKVINLIKKVREAMA
ncbi:MAG: sugar phosphate isomerase/epimerase family protein [Chitinophagaceae bacterium]